MNLILIMANQDGGAHVDPELDQDYAKLCVDSLGVHYSFNDIDIDQPGAEGMLPAENNVAFASVRQIAFELMLTLERYLERDTPVLEVDPQNKREE
ncbi:hypothetical protein FHR55_004279 [Xanthomonas arboricola]